MNDSPLSIAIDGPVASGKGDIAIRLAKKFNLLYIYTGAMYRALALACIGDGVVFSDESGVLQVLKSHHISIDSSGHILLDDVDVSERITHQDAAQGASDVGIFASVRSWMVIEQQMIAEGRRVVMEGRDIALRVLPNADLKIFLTATVEERAKRRFAQWVTKGISKTYEETLEDTKKRDIQDETRKTDPLQKVPDAWALDCTGMTQDEVVDTIASELKKRNLV